MREKEPNRRNETPALGLATVVTSAPLQLGGDENPTSAPITAREWHVQSKTLLQSPTLAIKIAGSGRGVTVVDLLDCPRF